MFFVKLTYVLCLNYIKVLQNQITCTKYLYCYNVIYIILYRNVKKNTDNI